MANRRQSLINLTLLPGALASGLLLVVALLAFGALWFFAPEISLKEIVEDDYLWHVIGFTFWQALLSAIFSIIPAIFLARALYRRRFWGRTLFLRLCAMTLVLPVLVAVFGILSVYGQTGWLAKLCQWLGLEYQFSPYGLRGILLAHIFFNMPLATRMLLQSLENIAIEQRQSAAQLGFNEWQQFAILEWPYLRRQMLPTSALIFMLCFASFATVLALGGGPAATTIELAIYQALSYDFDLGRATLLALIQLGCCVGLMLICQHINHAFSIGFSHQNQWFDPADNLFRRLRDLLVIAAALLLLIPPLLAVIVDGLNSQLLDVLQQSALWQATSTSLFIALFAGVICVILTLMLLWSSRELRLRNALKLGQAIELSGLIILAMPGIVLATGFFIFFNETIGIPETPYPLVIMTNALLAIPYALKVLDNPMRDLAQRYNPLCQSLEITGFNRFKIIELRALRKPIAQALAFACVISIGDFGVVALFGNEAFRTLPYYLYQQIGAYRTHDGAVTAMLLLLLCFCLFSLLERLSGKTHD
ncbi:thiamine/thiamine pyrophosphate ABC transporter permease ThiP [Providencia alcalifaciens]|uniref:thiamine/thiamine pyrophosphate ABC transporter permease ThiP n=1 Tax=Providencia alcalifaciens TaxID=126385 RepID=UPI00044CC458|nr:thiamine/thiamine pyrophosphate ABC transporter permease ThiP [Providencia alcalifaciens]ETT04093.1 thiamine/thiamine pyrophosphate ABC transporter, permease protein [Providencia alcalifaciens F90-2004]EUC95938.1 thiamine/thiamine pyrophosphate ABC transporter, permease protein [Providencia alcalifaciens PAL-2]MTB33001.1 thiamine/thiamine pyrophosphate ABC transporter permease ThiP [Providencia alcalifaciens]MTC99256.1 thiamine/thiamine pyrophosphate ABC transporter permease ThiP [Providenci